jgi:Ribosomal protein S3
MGQKVNPVGFRLGVNRGWDSVWYAKKKDFGNFLIEDFKIREYIKKNVINSSVSKVMKKKNLKQVLCDYKIHLNLVS